MTNSMMQNNQAAADANANRALISGNAQAGMWGAAASGISDIAGAWGSSFRTPSGGGGLGQTPACVHASNDLTSINLTGRG